MGDPFDVIPFDDIKDGWSKLGSGSFGNVYKGSYLGIDVAIKEVLPSREYDVAKYFEREWRLLKESRHPNVVLYLGLSRAPDPDSRIFIISEFIENGNLRQYIYDKSKPLPWRLRLSFATDIARALAYLHARKCIHRDLKGENLLVTANGRLKITDFGFARIAARNQEESRRLTFCGTDAYMSPEILLGYEFDLPTDIFSLGVMLAEIAARRLADETHFSRSAPSFTIDTDEVRRLASPGCPSEFTQLAADCLAEDPAARPTTRVILDRLRAIEAEVLARPEEAEMHTGSIKFMTGNRRHPPVPRIPSFGEGIGKDIRASSTQGPQLSEEDSDDELSDAVSRLESVTIHENGVPLTSRVPDNGSGDSQQPLLATESSNSNYSTSVIRGHTPQPTYSTLSPLSSILTVRAYPTAPNPPPNRPLPPEPETGFDLTQRRSTISIASYYTASEEDASTSAATEGGSSLLAPTLVHRFTLVKLGTITKRSRPASPSGANSSSSTSAGGGWSALDFFFASGLLPVGGAKCDVCTKRLGRKAALECDDCGLRAHIKCGEVAPRDCAIRASTSILTRVSSAPHPAPVKANKSSKSPPFSHR